MSLEEIAVLLIDDDEDDIFLTKDLLAEVKDFEITVDVAKSFSDARRLLRDDRHDIYLLDYRLGPRSGLDLLSEYIPDGPVIMLTGQGDEGTDVRALQSGASDYLVKDRLTADTLSRSMRYSLERRKFQRLLAENRERLDLALRCSGIGTWTWNLADRTVHWDDPVRKLFGFRETEAGQTIDEVFAHVHPDDREVVKTALAECEVNNSYIDIEFRVVLPNSNETRFIAMRGNCSTDERAAGPRRFAGACWDITQRRRDEEHRRLLLAELDHRVKNALQLVLAISRKTITHSGSFEGFIEAFQGRLLALADLHRLLTQASWQCVPLQKLLELCLQPYRAEGAASIHLSGEEVALPHTVAQSLYLIIHELATNAVKYGSLSTSSGSLVVQWFKEIGRSDEGEEREELVIKWKESGGPPVEPPKKTGFGMELIRYTLQYEADGTVALQFDPTGLACELRIPTEMLSADYRVSPL